VFLGRDAERSAVDTLLAAARVGEGGALVITGEPGIGKTALLDYTADTAAGSGCRLLRMRGTEAERDLPFAGLGQLLAPLINLAPVLPAPQATAIEVALALREGPPPHRFAVAAGTLGLVGRAAEDGPVGIVVDDGHLVDPASADALAFAARRVGADPVFIAVAARDGTGSPWIGSGLPRLELGALGRDATEELARVTAGHRLDPAVSDRLLEVAAGNPLAVRELAAHPELLDGVSPVVPPPVTDVLVEAFTRRAGALVGPALDVLLLVAVAEGDLAVAARATDAAGLDLEELERIEGLGLLRSGARGRAEFVHPLARAAVYMLAEPAARRRAHALVAEALPASQPDRRAWHGAAAVLGTDEGAARQLVEVGRRASARSAHAVAATAFERAAHLSPGPGDAARRFLTAGEAAWFAGDDSRAIGLLDQARQQDLGRLERYRLESLLGLVALRRGALREARDRLLAAAAEVASVAPGDAALMYAEAVDVCFYLLDVTGVLRAAAAVRALLEDDDLVLPLTARGVGWIAVGMARTLTGDPPSGPLQRGVEILADLGAAQRPEDAGVVVQSGWDVLGPLFLRDSETGRDLVRRAVERRRAALSVGSLPHLLFHVARDDAVSDRWTSAAAGYGEAISLARELGQVLELAASLGGLAWLTARQGDAGRARALANEALSLAREQDFRIVEAWCRFALAELELSLGDVGSAASGLAELAGWLEELGVRDPDLSPVPELVEALYMMGRRAEALQTAEAFLINAEHKGRPWSLARAARVRGILAADPEQRDMCFDAAAALHTATLDRFEAARTLLVRGELMRRERRRKDARTVLYRALTDFDALGARVWAERAAAELAASGATAQRRDTGPVLDLTPRELQIALLLVRGESTRKAAEALFLSPKTVEYHLRHVYTKLGIGSRAELAEALGRLPG
jgi:DNA-binding CsgD family transcriptional regulator